VKALSIKQPWAYAILRKGKDIENRTWKTKFRGYFLIHASKSVDKNAPSKLLKEWTKASLRNDTAAKVGGVVGSVELVDCVTEHKSKWFQGPVGFILKSPMVYRFIPYKGQLNFFEVKL